MSRGASRSATALADHNIRMPSRTVTVPTFNDTGEWRFRDEHGTDRLYSAHVFTCRYCGDQLAQVILNATEDRATYHRVSESVLIEDDPGCFACAAILVPTPLFVRLAGWRVLFADPRACCTVARIRKYADALWAKEPHLSDQWEAWAARLAKNSDVTVPRDHVPGNCRNI
jgi:hypothetical protein